MMVAFCRHPQASGNLPPVGLGHARRGPGTDLPRCRITNKSLESIWRNRNPKKYRDMATCLSVFNPEMLALLFGADTVRSPLLKSLSKICTVP